MLTDWLAQFVQDVFRTLLVESLSERARPLPHALLRRARRKQRRPVHVLIQRRCRERLLRRLRASNAQQENADASFPRLQDSARLLE